MHIDKFRNKNQSDIPQTCTSTENNENVLVSGIDKEEAEELEPLPVPPPPAKGGLPQDFQDALSIIFDKGVEKPKENASDTVAVGTGIESVAATADKPITKSTSMSIVHDAESISTFSPMDIDSQSQPEMHIDAHAMTVTSTVVLDEQSQYMLYGSMTDKPLVFNDVTAENNAVTAVSSLTKNIPTPPIQILDAAGNLTQIPGPVLEIGNDFMVLDANGQPTVAAAVTELSYDMSEARKKRLQELDDLAMLGIDAEDVCI